MLGFSLRIFHLHQECAGAIPRNEKPKVKATIPRASIWENQKIVALLKLRYSPDDKKNIFTEANKQKKAFWVWLTAKFNANVND